MKKTMILALALLAAACGSSSDSTPPPPTLDTPNAITTYLNGKTWVMQGADIPPYPNGYSENVNLATSTQCYNKVELATAADWTVTSTLGTLNGAPTFGSVGTCDRSTPSGTPLTFTSSTILIENVHGNGDCFDVTATYTGFAQAGRGKFSADGKTMTLELFFSPQASGANCASGAVGSGGITLTPPGGSPAPFTGNAQQVYRLQ